VTLAVLKRIHTSLAELDFKRLSITDASTSKQIEDQHYDLMKARQLILEGEDIATTQNGRLFLLRELCLQNKETPLLKDTSYVLATGQRSFLIDAGRIEIDNAEGSVRCSLYKASKTKPIASFNWTQ
jgi:hypothetical protein